MKFLANVKKYLVANKALAVILGLSFLASLAYSFYFQITPAVDARAYDVIAQNIVAGNGYREEMENSILQDHAITRVGPLYEYFLAGLYKVFGHSYPAVWVAQALLHAISAWLLYLTASLIFTANDYRRRIGLWAAAIFGLYPDLIEISAMLMTETLYLFFVCLLIYLFFLFVAKKTWPTALFLGLAAGLATLARPPVLFLTPVILFYFWRQKLWRPAAVFLVATLIVFIPWTARNWQTYGQIMPFGAAGNYNFWIGNWHGADGEQSPQAFHSAFATSHEIQEINPESMRQFKAFVREYPLEFLKLTALRVNKYFSVIRPMGWWFYQRGLGQALFIFASALASILLFISSLAGAIKALKTRHQPLNYLLALIVFTPLIIFVTVVETRYRFQIYPLLAILSGFFLAEFSARSWRQDKAFWLAALLILGNGLLDLVLSFGRFSERLSNFWR